MPRNCPSYIKVVYIYLFTLINYNISVKNQNISNAKSYLSKKKKVNVPFFDLNGNNSKNARRMILDR